MTKVNQKTPIIFDHDGGVDDLLSLMLLLTMDHIELIGVTITPADCFLSDATVSTLKLLAMFDHAHVPVAQGQIQGSNPFPADWRAQPKICNAFPDMLNQPYSTDNLSALPADEFIAQTLIASEPARVLMTGPCTNLVFALERFPECREKIIDIVWMGGAVDVPGNVAMHNHNKSAEWNAFWDPLASAKLIESGLTVYLVGLDATNHLPVNIDFLTELAKQRNYPMSALAGQFWATTINTIPSYEFTYFMWDVLATSVLANLSEAITFEKMELAVAITEPNAGQTYRQVGSGCWIDVATFADKDAILNYILQQFRR